MNTAPAFDKTLLGSQASKVDANYWNTVLDLHEKGQHKEAILGILRYVDPDLIERTGNADQTEFVIPHGSAVVHLAIKEGELQVRAPFLSTKDARTIPLLRQVSQINFSPLNLARIVLEEETLVFKYTSPLALCEPYKTYEAFREICFFADHYDDEFIQKFQAKWIQEPMVKPFSAENKSLAWEKLQAYTAEAYAYLEYFENKRSFGHSWDVLVLTLMKIEYFCSPQGIFRSELQKVVEVLLENSPVVERVSRGKDYLRKLQQYEQAAFESDLYTATTFIPVKFRSTQENIRSFFEEAIQRAKSERASNDHLGATLNLAAIILKLFYYHNVDARFAEPLESALLKASGKPWKEASNALWEGVQTVMQGDNQEKKRGGRLWDFLFANRG